MARKPVARKRPAAKRKAGRSRRPRLAERLREAEETLEAIRGGHVDALLIQGPEGEQVFTLEGADRRFRQLVEAMNEGALLISTDGTILYGNARFATLVAAPMESIIGTAMTSYVADASKPLVEALLLTRDGRAGKAEAELVDAAGELHPVYLSATAGWDEDLDLTCLIVTDLSDQRRDREIVAADRLTAQIVDQAAQGIVVCNPAGVIVRASQSAHAMIGANPLLRPVSDVFRLRSNSEQDLVERVLGGERVLGAEATLPGADDLALLLSAAPVFDDRGVVLGCVISFADITEQKRSAAERLRLLDEANSARAEAEAANQAKDQFLAMLGHELRNPLAPILTALEIMTMRGEQALQREREIIGRHVKHVVTLVGDLLDVARIAQGKVTLDRRPLDLALVIDDAVESASPLMEDKRHRLAIHVPAGLWVDGDSGRLCQVFANLLTNAARYTKREGVIEIEATRVDGEIRVVIRDNGVGIPAELLPHLFDMFIQGARTIERTEGGLGLGLAIVRSLVSLHGGTVSAHSDGPGHGSAFEVRLPARATLPARPSAGTPQPFRAVVPNQRVLIVDDNVDAADMLAVAVESSGFTTKTAYDGPSALVIAREFKPEIALLDIGLPVMDGYELARHLRANAEPGAALRLYAVTGYGRDTDKQAARAAGFDGHMVKPIDLKVLMATLARTE